MISIPITTLGADYTKLFDGDIGYSAGYLIVHNGAVEIQIVSGPGQGGATEGPGLPAEPGIYPLSAGQSAPGRAPDLIYGAYARIFPGSTPALTPNVYGAVFRPGDTSMLPSNTLSSTLNASGNIVNVNTGATLAYSEQAASVTVSAVTEATANQVIACPSLTFDGSTQVDIGFTAPEVDPAAGAGASVYFALYQQTGAGAPASIGILGRVMSEAAGTLGAPVVFSRRMTPAAAAQVYSVRAYQAGGNGTVLGQGGGGGNYMPIAMKVTVV